MIVADYDDWQGRSAQYEPGQIGRAMASPLRRAGEIIGVLAVDRGTDTLPFSDEDLRLLTLFANQASIAITNAQLFADAQRRNREFSHLYATSLDITARLDLKEVLEAVIRRTTDLVEAQLGEVVVYDEDSSLVTGYHNLGLKQVGLDSDLHPIGRAPSGLNGAVLRQRRPLRLDDYSEWSGRMEQVPGGLVGPMIGVPILHQDRLLGSLSLGRRSGARPFSDEDEQRLVLFANQAAVAIANARQVEELERLHLQQIEKERLDQQLMTAKAVQAGLLPTGLPAIPGWDVAALWRPAQQLGGDFYDLIPLADALWGLLIADVSEKGIPAALMMAVARSLFRVYASADLSPSATLERVNRDLVASSRSGMFVTAAYAVADIRSGKLIIAGAGHPPGLVLRGPGGEVQLIGAGGIPLGIIGQAPFREETILLQPHQALVLYTDGVIEARDSSGEQFGLDRLQLSLRQAAVTSSTQLIDGLDNAVRAFVGATPPADDTAYLVVRRED
jgi:serine phosphatase RsbU (regulator of sigma subunit)